MRKEDQSGQLKHLVKFFLTGFFVNDFLKFENQKKESIIVMLSMFSIIGGYIAHRLLFPYYLSFMFRLTVDDTWVEKTYFMVITMAITGIVSVINWNNLYIDGRDYNNLLYLPIKMKTLIVSKFLSTFAFIGIISLAFNIFAVIIFTTYLDRFFTLNPFYFGLTHFISNFMANLFVILIVAVIMGSFGILLKGTWYRRLTAFFQVVLLIFFASSFVWFPKMYQSLPGLKNSLSNFVYLFPPIWFVGLYETMVGNSNPFFVTAMMTGIVVVVLSAIIYLLTFKANYRRYLDPVTKAGILRTSLPRKLLNKFLHRFIVRDPLERAIFHFTYKTILRNRNAKLKLVLFIALPLSIAATEFIYIALEKGINYFAAIDTYWITIPFVFLSSLVVGTKYVLMQPVQIDANWIFKITGSKIGRCYKKGVSKAILVYGMLPLNLVVLAVSFLFWGPVPALLFTYYCALLSIISVEASFVGCNKIPFACEYSPTKLKLKTRWPIYLLSYFICLALFEVLAVFLLKNNVFFTLYTLLIAVAYAILRKVRKRNEVAEIVYEEDEEQDMITLGFD